MKRKNKLTSNPKTSSGQTGVKESSTRKKIDAILINLGWNPDEESPTCNVFTERCKTKEQHKLLGGLEPDYVLYQTGTDKPIAIIETKKPGEDLKKAIAKAGTAYASPLGIAIIFVSDGTITEAYDLRDQKSLKIDGEHVTDLLPEKLLLRFVEEGNDILTPAKQAVSRRELIGAFASANVLLRREGLREGIERFTEFSNLLFLKLISELEDDREARGEARILEKKYCWDKFADKDAESMLDYINDTILPRLIGKYNHSGDVFQPRLLIRRPETLKTIVDSLSKLTLLDTDSDIKGDAFEYFLKNSITVGNDLGEYFTPRHIVKVMVDLIDPKFGETVYDPCCGTGGFLIAAFQHLKRSVKLNAESLKILKEDSLFGRELTGTAKIAKMNMILTGDGHNNIQQQDSLEHPVKGKYNIVLTNYPFSQTTDSAKFYGLTGVDANPVFLAHVIEALESGSGRAAVVVPEGLLFNQDSQYVSVRKRLVEQNNLTAVVKLHSSVFLPYTGTPTSILFFEKGKQTSKVWYYSVREDGFKKTTSKNGRPPIDENDLTELRDRWNDRSDSNNSFTIDVAAIRENDYKLSLNSFRQEEIPEHWVKLGGAGGVCDVRLGGTPSTKEPTYWHKGHLPWVTITDMSSEYITETSRRITDAGVEHSSVKLLPENTVLLSFKLTVGKVAISAVPLYTNEAIAGLVPRKEKTVLPAYLYHLLSRMDITARLEDAAKGKTLRKRDVENIRIPLPSYEKQVEIVAQLRLIEKEKLELKHKMTELGQAADNIIAEYTSPV